MGRISVNPHALLQASDAVTSAADRAQKALEALFVSMNTHPGMCGIDPAGAKLFTDYAQFAQSLAKTGPSWVNGAHVIGTIFHTSAANHDSANKHSTIQNTKAPLQHPSPPQKMPEQHYNLTNLVDPASEKPNSFITGLLRAVLEFVGDATIGFL